MNRLPVLFVLLVITTSCQKKNDIDTIQPALFKNTWIESYEENPSHDIRIYRPDDYKEFPPARFRQVFDFKTHNDCHYLVLAPNDAHYMTEGVWTYENSNRVLTILNPDSEVAHRFEVIELKEDLLKLKRIQ